MALLRSKSKVKVGDTVQVAQRNGSWIDAVVTGKLFQVSREIDTVKGVTDFTVVVRMSWVSPRYYWSSRRSSSSI
jgi:hypothetical protein